MKFKGLTKKQEKQVLRQLRNHKHDRYLVDIKLSRDKLLQGFVVDSGVFRPEGMASQVIATWLSEHPEVYKDKQVLDMGCGSGIQGVVMSLFGAIKITFSDVSSHAILNTTENVEKFKLEDKSDILQGDLFEKIHQLYDVIVFNHPFFPAKAETSNPITRSMLDEGSLLKRFLRESQKYLNAKGVIFMPYFHLAGDTNNPVIQGPLYGWKVQEVHYVNSRNSIQNGKISIYKLERY